MAIISPQIKNLKSRKPMRNQEIYLKNLFLPKKLDKT